MTGIKLQEEMEALFVALLHLIIYFYSQSSLGVGRNEGIGFGESREIRSERGSFRDRNNLTYIFKLSWLVSIHSAGYLQNRYRKTI